MHIPVLFALIIMVLWIDVRNFMFCPRFSMYFFLLLHKLLIFSISSLSRSFRMLSDICICLRNFGDKFCSISEFRTITVETLNIYFYKFKMRIRSYLSPIMWTVLLLREILQKESAVKDSDLVWLFSRYVKYWGLSTKSVTSENPGDTSVSVFFIQMSSRGSGHNFDTVEDTSVLAWI